MSGNQCPRQVSDTGADFEHSLPHVGLNRIRHPAIEARRAGQRMQCLGAFVFVNVFCEGIPQNHVDRFEGILKSDLLALFIGAAVVADGRFVNPHLAPSQFDGQFRLDAETQAADGNALQ